MDLGSRGTTPPGTAFKGAFLYSVVSGGLLSIGRYSSTAHDRSVCLLGGHWGLNDWVYRDGGWDDDISLPPSIHIHTHIYSHIYVYYTSELKRFPICRTYDVLLRNQAAPSPCAHLPASPPASPPARPLVCNFSARPPAPGYTPGTCHRDACG